MIHAVIENSLSLAACTRLRRLTLYDFSSASDAMLALLFQIPSRDFHDLRLEITSADDVLTIPDSTRFTALLDSDSLHELRTLTVLYRGPLPVEGVLERLQENLLIAKHHDVLKVERLASRPDRLAPWRDEPKDEPEDHQPEIPMEYLLKYLGG